jgi:hypothetical protein
MQIMKLLIMYFSPTETKQFCCEISGSHGGEYEDGCLVGFCAM